MNPLPPNLTPLDPRVVKSYSGDYFLLPEGQEAEKQEYRKAVASKNDAEMLRFEEGNTGWRLLDPVPWQ